MDWQLMATTGTPGGPARRPGGARHLAETGGLPRVNPDRLDLAVAALVERLAAVVQAGVQVAALHSRDDPLSSGAVLPGGSPSWLAADLDLLVQLVRLAAAAGVVLPGAVAVPPSENLTEPQEHLQAGRSCYRDLIDVLGRLSLADEVPPPCRDDALRLLRQVERRVQHLDDGHPAAGDPPTNGFAARHGEFIPGELLG